MDMELNLTELIENPQLLDRETLYELRSLLALYPYYQTARLLMLKNLFLLHDPSFDEELRRAAVYITDRKKIFSFVEEAHYRTPSVFDKSKGKETPDGENEETHTADDNRTISLIDNFLQSIPKEEDEAAHEVGKPRRKPTPADATIDYVAYLMQDEQPAATDDKESDRPQMKGQSLIDDFIENDDGKIKLKEIPEYIPQIMEPVEEKDENEGYFTETLAKIYIKQGRYLKALEIIRRLNLHYPKKSAYFADQIRFLEKLILNNKQKNN